MRRSIALLAATVAILASPVVAKGSMLFYGVKATTPQRLSGSVAWWLFPADVNSSGFWQGTIIQVEPGLGGGKLQFGIFGEGGHTVLAAAKLSVLRTWRDPIGLEPDQAYLGVECEAALGGFLNVNLGVYGQAGR